MTSCDNIKKCRSWLCFLNLFKRFYISSKHKHFSILHNLKYLYFTKLSLRYEGDKISLLQPNYPYLFYRIWLPLSIFLAKINTQKYLLYYLLFRSSNRIYLVLLLNERTYLDIVYMHLNYVRIIRSWCKYSNSRKIGRW